MKQEIHIFFLIQSILNVPQYSGSKKMHCASRWQQTPCYQHPSHCHPLVCAAQDTHSWM